MKYETTLWLVCALIWAASALGVLANNITTRSDAAVIAFVCLAISSIYNTAPDQ